jgi:hypothetical protein
VIHKFLIDEREFIVRLQDLDSFLPGKNEILSDKYHDLTKSQEWYQDGYTLISSTCFFDHEVIKKCVKNFIRAIISDEFPEINLTGFSLETYHDYVTDDQHITVMSKTRRINPANLGLIPASCLTLCLDISM